MSFTYTKKKWNGDPAADREHFIGGSDAGTILGVNPWKSAYTLWAEKTGKIEQPDLSDNEAVWWGNYDEEGVAKRFCEKTGKKVKRSLMSYGIEEIPYLRGHIDRLIVGEKAGLECKTTSSFNKTDFDNGQIPPAHYAQCQFYMLVTGFYRWYYAVKRDNREFFIQEVDRSDGFIETMIDRMAAFWECVQSNTPPAVDGSESTTGTLARLYGSENAKDEQFTTDLGIDVAEALSEADKRKEMIKDLKEEETAYENIAREAMGEFQTAYAGDYRASWRVQSRSGGVDLKKLQKEFPSAYAQCRKPDTAVRIFTFKKLERKDNSND